MGYDVSNRGGRFFLGQSKSSDAAKALRKYRVSCGYDCDKSESLVDILNDLCWRAEIDDAGNIVDLYLNDERLGDEETFFEVLAPFVKPGSFIALEGEDGYIWCFYFDGRHCTQHHGVIVFPDIQPNNAAQKIEIST